MNNGDWFKIKGQQGIYRFSHVFKGDIIAYGGDPSPKGRRQYVSFPGNALFVPAKAPFTRREIEEDL